MSASGSQGLDKENTPLSPTVTWGHTQMKATPYYMSHPTGTPKSGWDKEPGYMVPRGADSSKTVAFIL